MLYGFMNFGHRAVEGLQRGLVAAFLAALFLTLAFGQAHALSDEPAFTVNPASGKLPIAVVDQTYKAVVFWASVNPTRIYSRIVSGHVPTGMRLDNRFGVPPNIYGTPTELGEFTFTMEFEDEGQNIVTETYTIDVRESLPSSDANLSGLTLSAGTLQPAFNSATVSYSVTVPNEVSSIDITPTASHELAQIVIDGDSVLSGAAKVVSLAVGPNPVKIEVKAENETLKIYNLSIVRAPVIPSLILAPAAGALPNAVVGTEYTLTLKASGGVAPYTFSAPFLHEMFALDPATGKITGTPYKSGGFDFTVEVKDSLGAIGKADYTIAILDAPKKPISFTPASGSVLPKAMAGEAYSAPIYATGGNGKLIYSLVPADGLPKGLVLNVSTGAISGALAEDAEIKDYGFAVSVEDADGASAKADYTLSVVERQAGVEDKVVSVPAGSTPLDVRLDANATGGPFTDAAVAFVDPPNAGEAEVTMGDYAATGSATPVGWYLKFKPNPAFSGKAVVGFTLTNANLGGAVQTASGSVTYMLAIDAAQVATDIDRLVQGFVGTRQGMIGSTIAVPGLRERRASAAASAPVTGDLSPNANGLTLNFATSLVQMNAAARATAGMVEVDAVPEAFNIWVDGTVMVHNREQNGDRWGSFAMLSLGADYLVNERALIGLSLHLDRMTDPTDQDAELVGTGWLAGPYASLELGEGVFFDASLRYGGSWNDIDTPLFDGSFDTTRWMLDASLSGQWRLGEGTVVTPRLRAVYFNEAVESYTVENAIGDIITIDGFTEEQFRLSIGAELAHSFVLENGLTLTPSIGATAGLSTLDATALFGQATAGLSLSNNDGWNLDGGVLINFNNEGAVSAGAKASLKLRF